MTQGRAFGVGLVLLAPALLLLIGLLVWPVAELSLRSFTDPSGPLVFYERLVSVPSYLQILVRTLMFSAGTALLCLLLGYPIAHALANAGPVARGVILVAVMLPFWTNLLVRSYGWIVFLSPRGVLNEALLALGIIQRPLELDLQRTGRADRHDADHAALHDPAALCRDDPSRPAPARCGAQPGRGRLSPLSSRSTCR